MVCAATELSVRCSQDLSDLQTTSVLRPDRRGEPVVTETSASLVGASSTVEELVIEGKTDESQEMEEEA